MTDTRELRERIESADKMLDALCRGDRRWTLSVPARPDDDPDLVIGRGLAAGRAALERVEKLEAALRPFAREADEWADSASGDESPFIGDYNPDGTLLPANFTVGDLRRARALLTPAPAGAED